MSMITKRVHDCYDHYELKTYAKFFNCDGCKMKGFGERYTCNLCGDELHKVCRHPKETISHENFCGSVFSFSHVPFTKLIDANKSTGTEFSKLCDACGLEISGFNYHCGEFDLHPCCVKLDKQLVINDTTFDLVTKVSSKCGKCGEKKISPNEEDVQGWSYVSRCKNYHFHVYCLNEVVQEAYMKHGDLALEKMDLRELVRYNRKRGGGNTFFKTIKSFVKILLLALLGDPTMLISNVVVESFSYAMQL